MKTRLYFILADENLFHPLYLLQLLKNLKPQYQTVGVTLAKDTYKKGYFYYLYQQFRLWGIVGFLYIGILSTLKKYLDKLNLLKDLSLRNITQNYHLKYFETDNVNAKDHLDYLRKLNIDIVISSCGQIFKKELLDLPHIACINRHSALLPKYGGVLPVFWAMFFEEKEFGASVHYMTAKIDQGDILSQESIPSSRENSLFRNYILAFQKSVEVTLKALENIRQNKITRAFYSNKKQYFSFPNFEKIQELKAKGYKTFSLGDIFSFLKYSG